MQLLLGKEKEKLNSEVCYQGFFVQLSENSAQNEGSSSEWKHLGINSACCHCHEGLQGGEHTTLEHRPHRRSRDDNVCEKGPRQFFNIKIDGSVLFTTSRHYVRVFVSATFFFSFTVTDFNPIPTQISEHGFHSFSSCSRLPNLFRKC